MEGKIDEKVGLLGEAASFVMYCKASLSRLMEKGGSSASTYRLSTGDV
jgi:hypothetical protein